MQIGPITQIPEVGIAQCRHQHMQIGPINQIPEVGFKRKSFALWQRFNKPNNLIALGWLIVSCWRRWKLSERKETPTSHERKPVACSALI